MFFKKNHLARTTVYKYPNFTVLSFLVIWWSVPLSLHTKDGFVPDDKIIEIYFQIFTTFFVISVLTNPEWELKVSTVIQNKRNIFRSSCSFTITG